MDDEQFPRSSYAAPSPDRRFLGTMGGAGQRWPDRLCLRISPGVFDGQIYRPLDSPAVSFGFRSLAIRLSVGFAAAHSACGRPGVNPLPAAAAAQPAVGARDNLEVGKPDMPPMDLSIIFVNWNSLEYLQGSIASIYENTEGASLEI